MIRRWLFAVSAAVCALVGLVALVWPPVLWALVLVGPLVALGLRDAFQTRPTILRNFPSSMREERRA